MITLTTDFGPGFYHAQMKGVIYCLNPDVTVVDITHSVTRHSIAEGAFVLAEASRFYPAGTIHAGVVDPGVGSARAGVIVETEKDTFIGPDNGLFSIVLEDRNVKRLVELKEHSIIEKTAPVVTEISPTFHGRDIFASAAALLSAGVDSLELGSPLEKLAELSFSEDSILYVDSFGNVVTNIREKHEFGEELVVECGGKRHRALFVETFSDVPPGNLVVLTGSTGFLEVDVNEGDAARKLKAKVGGRIRIHKNVG